MGEAEPGPEKHAESAIERHQIRRGPAAELRLQPVEQKGADPGGAEDLAFEAEMVRFVIGIDDAQGAAEFETVDDLQRFSQADMFGAEVAVAFDDPAPAILRSMAGRSDTMPASTRSRIVRTRGPSANSASSRTTRVASCSETKCSMAAPPSASCGGRPA